MTLIARDDTARRDQIRARTVRTTIHHAANDYQGTETPHDNAWAEYNDTPTAMLIEFGPEYYHVQINNRRWYQLHAPTPPAEPGPAVGDTATCRHCSTPIHYVAPTWPNTDGEWKHDRDNGFACLDDRGLRTLESAEPADPAEPTADDVNADVDADDVVPDLAWDAVASAVPIEDTAAVVETGNAYDVSTLVERGVRAAAPHIAAHARSSRPAVPERATIVDTAAPMTTGHRVMIVDYREIRRMREVAENGQVTAHEPRPDGVRHQLVTFDDVWFDIVAAALGRVDPQSIRIYRNAPQLYTVVVGEQRWYTVLDGESARQSAQAAATSAAIIERASDATGLTSRTPVVVMVDESSALLDEDQSRGSGLTASQLADQLTRAARAVDLTRDVVYALGYGYALGVLHYGEGDTDGVASDEDCRRFATAYADHHRGMAEHHQVPVHQAYTAWATQTPIGSPVDPSTM